MKQIESFPIDNPCQQICRFNRQRYCRTCMRHMDERIAWDTYDDEEKRTVLRKCHRRRLAYRRAAYLQMQAMQRQQQPVVQQQLSLFEALNTRTTTGAKAAQPDGDEDDPQLPLF